jgi:HSP20 family protein
MNRVFDSFWRGFDRPFGPLGAGWDGGTPRCDIVETDKAVEVSVELPGMVKDDIEVSLTDDTLTIKGERKAEREEEKKGYFLSERSYGSFFRSIPIPPGVDHENAEAAFKNGVLTMTLPKTTEAQAKVRKIAVKAQ